MLSCVRDRLEASNRQDTLSALTELMQSRESYRQRPACVIPAGARIVCGAQVECGFVLPYSSSFHFSAEQKQFPFVRFNSENY